MGERSMRDDTTSAEQGRRARVAGGFPFRRRVALTERDGALLTTLSAKENLSVGAYLARLVERHLAGSRDPLPASTHDILTTLNMVSGDLRAVLREARAEGVLLNQIARHLNTHPTGHAFPHNLIVLLGRTLDRHHETATAIDALLRHTDHLITDAAALLHPRTRRQGGAG